MNATRIATAVLATGIATAAFLGTAAVATAATAPSTAASYESQVLTLTNQERAKAGCAPLAANAQLAAAAKAHDDDMAKSGTMTHTGTDGSTPATRIQAAGYTWKMAGENVAYGQKTPAQVMTDWMNSPAHKANILNCGYKDLGVAYTTDSRGRAYWTQNFGAR
jgi:uncharacterized protein YkwD